MADQQPPPLPDGPDPNLQGPGQVQANPATGVQPTNADLQQTIALLTAQLQLARQPNPAPPAGMAGAGVHVNPPGRVAAVIAPRVGGTIDNMAWVGGPNLATTAGRLLQPVSINAYRPADFRNRERNDATIKQGISKDLRLELNGSVSLMVWLRTVRAQIEDYGLDTLFWVYIESDPTALPVQPGREVYLLRDWGSATRAHVKAWTNLVTSGRAPTHGNNATVDVINAQVCAYDVAGLKLAKEFLRNSIGSSLYNLVESELLDDCLGPEYFFTIMSKMTGTSPQAVRNLTNELVAMKLSNQPQENVNEFSTKISAKCLELIGTPNAPLDLAYITARTYTHTTDTRFETFANNKTNELMRCVNPAAWSQVVMDMNEEYDLRVNASDWGPTTQKSSKEQQEDLRGMIGSIQKTVMDLQQHRPKPADDNKKPPYDSKPEYQPPSANGPFEKTLKNKTVKWCAECRNKKGLWTGLGRYPPHFTSEHVRGFRLPQAEPPVPPPTPAPAPAPAPTAPNTNTGTSGLLATDSISGLDFVTTDLRATYASVTEQGNDFRGC